MIAKACRRWWTARADLSERGDRQRAARSTCARSKIEEECLKILALHQPVAVDLRRDGDGAQDQHRAGADRRPGGEHRRADAARWPIIPTSRFRDKLERMGVDAIGHGARRAGRVRASSTSTRPATCAGATTRSTAQPAGDRRLVRDDAGPARPIEPALHLFSVSRHVERIADRATNIAEDVIYLVEGEIARTAPSRSDASRDHDDACDLDC